MFGLANILNNQGSYDEAIYYYTEVIQLQPTWIPAYECLAFIYEYKRIMKEKSREFANNILAREP